MIPPAACAHPGFNEKPTSDSRLDKARPKADFPVAGFMLKWSETDLTEFFGVAAVFHDDAHSHEFEVRQDGLRLLITIFDLECAVYVSIFKEGLIKPLFTVQRELCTHVHITDAADFRRCFEAGVTKHPVTDMGIPPVLERGVRVYVEPQLQVELIEPRFDSLS